MKTTPRYAIPYAESGDDMRDYPTVVDLPAASRIEALMSNPTWVSLTPVGSGWLRYKVVSGVVFVDVNVNVSFPSGTAVVVTTTPVPAAIKPLEDWRGSGHFGGGLVGYLWINASGQVTARQANGSTQPYVQGNITYPLP